MKKLPEPFARIGLAANHGKTSSGPLLRRAARLIAQTGRQILCDEATSRLDTFSATVVPDLAALARACDLLLVFGGDGTMLRAVRECKGAQTPILGINVGRLGFLTAVPSSNLVSALKKIWANEFSVQPRALLEATCDQHGTSIDLCALNDIVISRSAARMIELEVSVNGESLTRYRSDGLIVSSPTGSTAYSLSAGGAIVSPEAAVFAITPICPHTLTNRSVIVGLNSIIKVKVISRNPETTVTADGQIENNLRPGDVLTIRRSRRVVRLVRLSGSSFFNTLRQKLHWSGSNV